MVAGTTHSTDSSGSATLIVAPGSVQLTVVKAGYVAATASVQVAPGAQQDVVVDLQPQPTVAETVSVVASTRTDKRLDDQPMRVEVVPGEEVQEKLMMTPGDVSMLLNETNGLRVQTTSPSLGGANVRIQGLRGRYTQILADGLPLYGGQTGSLGLLQIPPMDLGQVEVIKGVASALYGMSAIGGVVNLVSRRPPTEGHEAEVLVNRTSREATDAVSWLAAPLGPQWGYTFVGGDRRSSSACALSEKDTEVLTRERARPVGNFRLVQGRVRVTTHVTGYERRRVHGQDLLGTEPLELPPTCFETTAIWLEMPDELKKAVEARDGHFMGGIHAVEHAALALCPLFALCDRHDVAGISFKLHPGLGKPAIFLYDGNPGGAGLMASLFDRVDALLEATLELVADCECEAGCPSCVHSPKCGSGNRPIDKAAARHVLELLLAREPLPAGEEPESPPAPRLAAAPPPAADPAPDVVFFDLETQRAALEVGGWHNAHLMRVALAVLYEARGDRFATYREGDVEALLRRLRAADLVVGFNVRRFDYRVLRGYTDFDLDRLATYDLLDEVHGRLGFRISLAHLGQETLGRPKLADGLQSLQWWREGRVDEIETYCRADVAILRDLFRHAESHEHLIFRTKLGERVRLPLRVSLPDILETVRSAERTRGARPEVVALAGA